MAVADLERHATFRLPGEPHWHVLAERGGGIVGMAEAGIPRMDGHPGWIDVTVRVWPENAALYDSLSGLAEARALDFGARTLVTRAREDWWEKGALEARGYAVHDTMWPSVLDLTTLDFAAFRPFEDRAAAAGITLSPLPSLGDIHADEAMQRRLYGLVATLLRDVPSSTPVSVWPFETWQRRFLDTLKQPEGFFVAVSPAGDWVGVSELHTPMPSRPGTLMIGLTGVLAAWRRHGIAYALKLAAARAGLERGYTKVFTGNHSRNAPMLAINEAMGFVRESAWLTLTKEVMGDEERRG
ncbi:GNAT family N-acetyltransferase [Deinococcus sp. KSM4-11]|nr:GNAT family N-acetyltransferase [Deinococcus sp. KSM4-11]